MRHRVPVRGDSHGARGDLRGRGTRCFAHRSTFAGARRGRARGGERGRIKAQAHREIAQHLQQRRQQQREGVDDLDQRIDRGTGSVLAGITNGVAGHCGHAYRRRYTDSPPTRGEAGMMPYQSRRLSAIMVPGGVVFANVFRAHDEVIGNAHEGRRCEPGRGPLLRH